MTRTRHIHTRSGTHYQLEIAEDGSQRISGHERLCPMPMRCALLDDPVVGRAMNIALLDALDNDLKCKRIATSPVVKIDDFMEAMSVIEED